MNDDPASVTSNKYASQPVMEWLSERVDRSLAGMKFGEAVELIERLKRESAHHLEARLNAGKAMQEALDAAAIAEEQRDRLRAALERLLTHPNVSLCECGEPGCATRQAREALSGESSSTPYQMTASEESSFTKVLARKRVPDETEVNDG